MLLVVQSSFAAISQHPKQLLKRSGFDQKLGSQLPLDAEFLNAEGETVLLGDYFGQKPVILVFAYYECPMLCTLVLNGLTRGLRALSFSVGNEFGVVVVSIDPGETPALALQKKKNYLGDYGRESAEAAWHFLTGKESSIHPLTEAAGFRYEYDPETDQFVHASGIIAVTPEGKVSRYLFGIDFSPKSLKLVLMDAAKGQIGTLTDKIMFFCYHYDPAMGRYTVSILNIIRVLGLITVAWIAGYIYLMLRKEKRQSLAKQRQQSGTSC